MDPRLNQYFHECSWAEQKPKVDSVVRKYQEVLERVWPNVILDYLSDLISAIVRTIAVNKPPEERLRFVVSLLMTSCRTGWRN